MEMSSGRHLQEWRALGHYQLVCPLDQRNAIEVWLGQHISLGMPVALKILRQDGLQEEELQHYEMRLQNEAGVLADLHHQYIVGFRDYRRSRGLLHIVMQYAPNGSVARYHPTGRKLPLSLVRIYTWQIGLALSSLHQQGLIHRDVKPGNILLLHPRHTLLADFGLAMRVPTSSYQSELHTSGTAAYMPPEQYYGYPSPASDQYGLATCVYEWLTGRRPFYGEAEHMMRRRERYNPLPVSKFRPELPTTVDEIMLIALHRDPARRYRNVLDFARDLLEATRGIHPPLTRRISYYHGEHPVNTSDEEGNLPSTLPHRPETQTYRLFNR
jgi:serine/threonine protein kinase